MKAALSVQILAKTETKEAYRIVDCVLEHLRCDPGITYQVNPMDTVIEGDLDHLMVLSHELITLAHNEGAKSVLTLIKVISGEGAEGFLDGVRPAMDRHNRS